MKSEPFETPFESHEPTNTASLAHLAQVLDETGRAYAAGQPDTLSLHLAVHLEQAGILLEGFTAAAPYTARERLVGFALVVTGNQEEVLTTNGGIRLFEEHTLEDVRKAAAALPDHSSRAQFFAYYLAEGALMGCAGLEAMRGGARYIADSCGLRWPGGRLLLLAPMGRG